jgi:hypothetical protein
MSPAQDLFIGKIPWQGQVSCFYQSTDLKIYGIYIGIRSIREVRETPIRFAAA